MLFFLSISLYTEILTSVGIRILRPGVHVQIYAFCKQYVQIFHLEVKVIFMSQN